MSVTEIPASGVEPKSHSGTAPEVEQLLAGLRRGIRWYLLLRGMAIVMACASLAVLLSLAIDGGYFLVDRSDLSQNSRIFVSGLALGVLVLTFLKLVVLRLAHNFSPRELAIVLERRFPELESRLITIVELAGNPVSQHGISSQMYHRTQMELRQLIERLHWNNVFDPLPLRRSICVSFCLLVSLAGIAYSAPETMHLWIQRNLLLQNVAWPRHTSYHLTGKLPSQDRVLDFQNRTLFHPRGADLTLQIQINEGSTIPDQVDLRYQGNGSQTNHRVFFTRQGTNRFLYTLTGILDDIEFRVRAGDSERHLYRIHVVDPPRLEKMEYFPHYPEYTHLNPPPLEQTSSVLPQVVRDSSLSLPLGTQLSLQGVCNKPLSRVMIATDRFELELEPGTAVVSLFERGANGGGGEKRPMPSGSDWLSQDGRSFKIPFVLAMTDNSAALIQEGKVVSVIPIAGTEQLHILLEDTQGIRTSEPIGLTLQGIEDESPRVVTQLQGIGASITRKARIPVRGRVTDDYGVESAQFEFQVEPLPELRKHNLVQPPAGVREFILSHQPTEQWEVFDTLPLELKEGQKLTLGLIAQDGDTLNGPHKSAGERFQFSIVSDEALLSILHARELNLRQRFEQIIAEFKRFRADLQGVVLDKNPVEKSPSGESPPEASPPHRLGIVARNLLALRKSHNETLSVEQGFKEIREETLNNRVETTQSLERLDQKLLKPLRTLNQVDYNELDQDLGELQILLEEARSLDPLWGQITQRVERMLLQMDSILREMRRLETYGELVEMLKSIKSQQEMLKKQTESERKRQAIEGLK